MDRESEMKAEQEQMRAFYASITMPSRPRHSVKTYPTLDPVLVRYLVAHGCQLHRHQRYTTVIFPEGTTTIKILPRLMEACETVHLPDGATLYEQQHRGRIDEQVESTLRMPREAMEQDE